MALGTEAAAVNTAIDAVIAAWEAYLDTLSTGDKIRLVRMKKGLDTDHSNTTKNSNSGIDASLTIADWDFGRCIVGNYEPNIADSFMTSVASSGPLFWKLTNEAGEIA